MAERLRERHCLPCKGGEPPLAEERVAELLKDLPEWEQEGQALRRAFRFKNFRETMAFVSAVAWIANRENHHPDLEVGYNRCVVRYSTHAIGGLSENDFICAARINALLE
ncbi:MAG: 4a-hydroxytetrahydrobiopterin dehydratase [Chloroflexi bacterium]|nr:4a-hydroxytetrahydrobiopterin dehydratase [Chloroflexota bacterium]